MTAATPFVPDRGDVVWLDFTPQAGHEQAGRRPALVLSPASYNRKTGLMLCCPVTNQAKGYPFEVPAAAADGAVTKGYPFEVPAAAADGAVTGVALADQVRCLDWRSRNAAKFARATTQCVLDVSAKAKLLLP